MSRRTETAYKAKSPGKVAQHIKAQDSGDMVNAAVVLRQPEADPPLAEKITTLIRGELSNMHLIKGAHLPAMADVIGQQSAEVIVGVEKRAQRTWEDSLHRRTEHRKGRSFNEFS